MRALLPLTDADLVAVLGHGHVGTELSEEWCVHFEDGSRVPLQHARAVEVRDRARASGRDVYLCRRYTTDWEVVDQ